MQTLVDQAVERARLLLLAVALLLCAVPTAQAIRCPTLALDSPSFAGGYQRLNEEMPAPEPGVCYAVWVVDSQGRIGLFVGNNPLGKIDPLGLAYAYTSDAQSFSEISRQGVPGPFPYIKSEGWERDRLVDYPAGLFNNALSTAGNGLYQAARLFDQGLKAIFPNPNDAEAVTLLLATTPAGWMEELGGLLSKLACLRRAAKTVATPYGSAIQAATPEARALLQQMESGGTVYKGGFLGRSETGASQFLSAENPLNPGYASRYGIPPQNANFDFVLTGKVQPGAPLITRPAPPIPPNPGGALEGVTTPGSFRIDSFYMP